MPQIRVTPKAGLYVAHQFMRANLQPEGETVEDSVYWRRRAADGDVDLVEIAETEPVSGKPAKPAR